MVCQKPKKEFYSTWPFISWLAKLRDRYFVLSDRPEPVKLQLANQSLGRFHASLLEFPWEVFMTRQRFEATDVLMLVRCREGLFRELKVPVLKIRCLCLTKLIKSVRIFAAIRRQLFLKHLIRSKIIHSPIIIWKLLMIFPMLCLLLPPTSWILFHRHFATDWK